MIYTIMIQAQINIASDPDFSMMQVRSVFLILIRIFNRKRLLVWLTIHSEYLSNGPYIYLPSAFGNRVVHDIFPI